MDVLPRGFVLVGCRDEAMLRAVLSFRAGFLTSISATTPELAFSRFRRCPTAFCCVTDPAGELHGYFILLPLTSTAVEKIRSGAVTAGRHILDEDLADGAGPLPGAYLSVVCATTWLARAATVAGIVVRLRRLCAERDLRRLFVRAATEEGARVAARLTERAIAADGRIHEIDLTQFARTSEW